MKGKNWRYLQKPILYVKRHKLLSAVFGAVVAAVISWGVMQVLPAKAMNVEDMPHKELTCALNYSQQMATKNVSDSNLKVLYKDIEVESPIIYCIKIENTGSYSIINDDFRDPFSIRFSGSKRILSINIPDASNRSIVDDILEDIHVEGIKLSIGSFYLNTSESFMLQIIVDGEPTDILYDYRISDIDKVIIEDGREDSNDDLRRDILILVFLIAALIAIMFTIVHRRKESS